MLAGMNLQSQGQYSGGKTSTRLSMLTQDGPGPKLEGSGAVLVCAPTDELKPIL